MGKKTRYVRLGWTSAADTALWPLSRRTPISEAGSSSEHDVNKSANPAMNIEGIVPQEILAPSEMPSSRSKAQLATTDLPRLSLETHSPSSAPFASLPQQTERLFPRKPAQTLPVPGKIYFLPDGRHFRNSVIHNQKKQDGFFQHPVLVVGADGEIVQFYAMTKEPPRAIRDLDIALRIGAIHEDEGLNILRLASDSDIMLQQTWVNLEQRFFIEWENLDKWAVHVRVHQDDFYKITRRVFELEADQNRFIYKPLLRDMSIIQPGTVIMMPNTPNSSTLGAPIVVIENNYPNFCFLRVKRFEDNVHFKPESRKRSGSSRARSLAISKFSSIGHDGTPVLFLDENSPEVREKSYVELDIFKHGRLDQTSAGHGAGRPSRSARPRWLFCIAT
jgi:hypothetical protein